MFKNIIFRYRIFAALVLITLLFLTAMAIINYYQNKKNFEDRKINELQRVEQYIQESIVYGIKEGKFPDSKSALKEKISEFSSIYNLNMNVYDLNGHYITGNLNTNNNLNTSIISSLKKKDKIIKDSLLQNGNHTLYSSYSFIKNERKPVAVLQMESVKSESAASSQTKILIKQYVFLVIFLMILSALVAWLISKNLTKKLNRISEKLKNTKIISNLEPLHYDSNDEIKPLVDSYNSMQIQIADQTRMLKKTEHTEAWKEMARQVAHEINNPLTPLRLTVQNFHRKYQPDDPDNHEKVKNLTKTVVHQIDILSAITKSFADFAKMPLNDDTEIEIVDTIKKTISIFPDETVNFASNTEKLYYHIDGLYLSRIITNIVKNGIQSIPNDRTKKIEVYLKDEPNNFLISVADNGTGISDEHKEKVFKTNFTTKSEGMGLGLSMVKKIVEDYGGKIWFESQPEYGTVFFIEFIKNNHAN